jgi:predicted DNA binding CopG/RHH family protein
MRPIQYFSKEYLAQCEKFGPLEILEFLESFRQLHGGAKSATRLISIKVEGDLLTAFRARAKAEGVPYQTMIKRLMREWVYAASLVTFTSTR